MTSQTLVGKGLLFIEDSRSHSLTRMYTLSVELLWTSDQPEAEASTWQQKTLTSARCPSSQQAKGCRSMPCSPRGHRDRL